jgi:glycosyltransferase involved in cell wall biosynthesis
MDIFVAVKVKANILHHDFNPCGGGERVSFATMQAISEMGIDFDITTYSEPDLSRLVNTYGKGPTSAINNAKRVNVVNSFSNQKISGNAGEGEQEYDIYINTHPDLFPYYQNHFSKYNAITYCHFPMARHYIESKNQEYIRRDLRIKDQDQDQEGKILSKYDSNLQGKNGRNKYFKMVEHSYMELMTHSTIITNSEFSRSSIFEFFNGGTKEVHVIRPPVDVELFRDTNIFSSHEREDIILVVSRINKRKEIENAIKLAKLLKQHNIGDGMRIIGNIDYANDLDYFLSLHKMVKDFELDDFVTIETNLGFNSLVSAMRKAKTYFHPMVGEHFGMSIVESMSAGLVPIVPDIGGPTEYVPKKYHFKTLEEAADKIFYSFHISNAERIEISNLVNDFSISSYIKRFQRIVNDLLT